MGLKLLVLACMLVASLSIKKYPENGIFSIKTTTGSYIAPSPSEVEMPPAKSDKPKENGRLSHVLEKKSHRAGQGREHNGV